LLMLALLIGASSAQAVLPVGLSQNLALTHDSENRTYDVLRPAGNNSAVARPLVVDLHGHTSNGNDQRALSDWSAIAETNDFLVAWPDGLDNSWNAGICCGTAVSNNVDDVGFIRAMVAAIQAEAGIDTTRVYVTGLSNGGAMTQRLACEAADLFSAAAPMAFPVPYLSFANDCQPTKPIPVLSFMGLTDTVIPYSGAAPSFAAWRDKNSCNSAGTAPEINETYGGSTCLIDTSCDTPVTAVGLCSVTGSTFSPPLNNFDGHLLYINDDNFPISQRAWDFMGTYGAPSTGPNPGFLSPITDLILFN
jgi:polyhydroxybutyrate depolymerase